MEASKLFSVEGLVAVITGGGSGESRQPFVTGFGKLI